MEIIFGIIVGVLSVIVASLIGFQVMNVCFINKYVKNSIKKEVKKEKEELNEKINDIKRTMSFNLFFVSYNTGAYDDSMIHALSAISNTKDKELRNTITILVLRVLKSSNAVRFTKDGKSMWYEKALKTLSREKNEAELMNFVDSVTVD